MTGTDTTTSERETWLDWLPHSGDAMLLDQFLDEINHEYGIALSGEQLRSWEDEGLLPAPIRGNGYPPNAELVVRSLMTLERDGVPAAVVRQSLRSFAASIDETAARDIQDHLAEVRQSEKGRRETWQDWIPEEGRDEALLDAEPLLTRDELVAELNGAGMAVSTRDLIHWQTVGTIPYPDRRRHKGATRAVYPQWMISTIHLLRNLQEQGYKLREIGPFLRGDLYYRLMPQAQTPRQQRDQDKRLAKRAFFPMVEELDPRIRSFARIHERLHGGNVAHAELHLIDDHGARHTYWFLVGDAENAEQSSEVDAVR